MMLHHVSVGSRDVVRAAAFYDQVLKPLGYKRVMEVLPHAVGYGGEGPEFWVGSPANGEKASVGNGVHISFAAPTKQAVKAFHAAALKAGGSDEGAPGPRPDYGPEYYAAFCRDLDGNKLEAVLITLPGATAKRKKAAPPAKRAMKAARGGKAKPTKMKAKRRR